MLSPAHLHALIFRGCSCTLDAEHSHFIRRTPGNQIAYALVVSNETVELLADILTTELFFIQRINEDGLNYSVIWDKNEWEHSNERRKVLRAEFLMRDVDHLRKTAREQRLRMISDNLFRTALWPRDKCDALALSLTNGTEERYAERANALMETLKGAFATTNVTIYFPLEVILKSIDHRNILQQQHDTNTPSV